MEKNYFIQIILLATFLVYSNAFCWVDGTCQGPPPPQLKLGRKRGQGTGVNDTKNIRRILKTHWQYMRQKLFYGSWEDTLFELEWFMNQVRKDEYLRFTDNKNIWQFCRIDKLNLAKRPTLRFNVSVDIEPKYYYEAEQPVYQYLEDSIKKFLHIYKMYNQSEDGVVGVITCGEKQFELLELVADHIDSGKRLYPDVVLRLSQEIQDECGVYLSAKEVEEWLKIPPTMIGKRKPYFNPKFLCVKCMANIFDLLSALWIFENCSNEGTCAQYGDWIVQNMAKDIADMFETCIETHL